MSTDHTSGTPWETAVDQTANPSFVTPSIDDAVSNGPKQAPTGIDPAQVDRVDGKEPVEDHLEQDPTVAIDLESDEASGHVSLQGKQTDGVEFRVVRPGTPVRRLRLTGHRYTFGNVEGCSIRLNDDDLRPVHAVLTRDGSKVFVHADSTPIHVNDTLLTDAELRCGDVLRLGAYQFELLDSGQRSAPPNIPTSEESQLVHSVGNRQASDPLTVSSNEAHRGQTKTVAASENAIQIEQLHREIEQWRERQDEFDRREANLRERESELQSREENLLQRESELKSQQDASSELHDEHTKNQEELLELQVESENKQEALHQLEIALRNQEIEFQQRLEKTTAQLHQSQEQAETASQAAQQMRDQLDSLDQQIDELSNQRADIELRERQQQLEHEQQIEELRKSRDEAIESLAESDAKRGELESRLVQLEASLESLQQDRGNDLESQHAKLVESEREADELRQQVQQLQQKLADATQESEKLRADYEEAFATVVELESIIDQASQTSDQDREARESEADELRVSLQRLSTELKKANQELTEIRDTNAALSVRLEDMQRQRDEARADADARPTVEAFQSLQEALALADDQLSQTRDQYTSNSHQLSEVQQQREFVIEEDEDHDSPCEDSSRWNLDSPRESDHRETEAEWNELARQSEEAAEPTDLSETIVDGSLANMLIKDLDEDAKNQVHDAQQPMSHDSDWDAERSEEAYATKWSNDPDGYRVEEIDEGDPNETEATDETITMDATEETDFVKPSAEALNPGNSTADKSSEDESDDSIEAYMNRLLRRVQGQPLDDATEASTSTDAKVASNQQAQTETKRKVAKPVEQQAPIVPRSQAPEKTTSLSAMRDLANTSARNAISRSVRIQTRDTQIKGMVSFACALGAIICGIASYFLIPGVIRHLAVAMTVLVAAIYIREGWLLFSEASHRLKSAKSGRAGSAAPEDGNEQVEDKTM